MTAFYAPLAIAGLSVVPAPWIPSEGEEFEGRLRSHGDRWFCMRMMKWSIDPTYVIVHVVEDGPRAYDVIVEMRPVSP